MSAETKPRKPFVATFVRRTTQESIALQISERIYPNFDAIRRDVVELFKIDETLEQDLISETETHWEYEYENCQIWKRAATFDTRLPQYGQELFLIDSEERWQEAIRDVPWDEVTWAAHTGEVLLAKLNWMPEEDADPQLGKETMFNLRFEAACGLWEMASNRTTHPQIEDKLILALMRAVKVNTAQEQDAEEQYVESRTERRIQNFVKRRNSARGEEDIIAALQAAVARPRFQMDLAELDMVMNSTKRLAEEDRLLSKTKYQLYRTPVRRKTDILRTFYHRKLNRENNAPEVKIKSEQQRSSVIASGMVSMFASAAGAMSAMGATRELRHRLLSLGVLECVLQVLKLTLGLTCVPLGEAPRPGSGDGDAVSSALDNMQGLMLTAVAVMCCDETGRMQLCYCDAANKPPTVEPTTGWEVLTRYAVQGGTRQARKMAVNVLCSVLNFDPEARSMFAKYGGMEYVNQVLQFPDVHTGSAHHKESSMAVCAASIVLAYCRDREGAALLIRTAPIQAMMETLLAKVQEAVGGRVRGECCYSQSSLEQLVCAFTMTTACVADALHSAPDAARPKPVSPPTGLKHIMEGVICVASDGFGLESGKRAVPEESMQMRLVNILYTLVKDVQDAHNFLQYGGLTVLLRLVCDTTNVHGVRCQAMAAVLQMAAYSEEVSFDDELSELDHGLLGPLREMLIEGGALEAMLGVSEVACRQEVAEDIPGCNPLLEGANATLMYLCATRVQLDQSQMRRLLWLCGQGPHAARHFLGCALWCAARNADNCTLMWEARALDTAQPSTSIVVALHSQLNTMWAWTSLQGHHETHQLTVAHTMWLLATCILLLNHSFEVRRWSSLNVSMTSGGLSALFEEDELHTEVVEEDPLHVQLLRVGVHLVLLGASVGTSMSSTNFMATAMIHHLVEMSSNAQVDVLLPLILADTSGLLRIAASEDYPAFIRHTCTSLYSVLCDACSYRPDGTADPKVLQDTPQPEPQTKEELIEPIEEGDEGVNGEATDTQGAAQSGELSEGGVIPNDTEEGERPSSAASDTTKEQASSITKDAPSVPSSPKKQPKMKKIPWKWVDPEPPLEHAPGPVDQHVLAVALMREQEQVLMEAGVRLAGHLAYRRKRSQRKLIESGAAEALCDFLYQLPSFSSAMTCLILKALLNLSTIDEGQLRICRLTLRKLLTINQDTSNFDAKERVRLTSGLLTNLYLNTGNRTRFYKEEIREKSKIIADARKQLHIEHEHLKGPKLTVEQEAEARRIESLAGVKREFWEWQEDVLYVPPMFDHRKKKPPARIVDHLAVNPIQPPDLAGNGNNAFLTEVAGLGSSMNLESSLGDTQYNSKVEADATRARADPRRPAATYLLKQKAALSKFNKPPPAAVGAEMFGVFKKEMNLPLHRIWAPVVGHGGQLLPVTPGGQHVTTPAGTKDTIQMHANRWRPKVQASVLGPLPRPRTGFEAAQKPTDAPITIQLAPGRARNRKQFDRRNSWERNVSFEPPSETPCCQLYMWRHTEGSVVHEELFPKYELADGTKLYLYQSRKLLVEEIPFELEEPPPLPLSLALVDLVELPDSTYALESLLSIYNLTQLPPPLKPRPAMLPKTPTGFISYDSGIPDFLVAGLEEEGGLVRRMVEKPPPPEMDEEVQESWEETVFRTHMSIFAPRRAEADARAYFNHKKAWKRAFQLDWSRMAEREGIVKTVGGPEVLSQMEQVFEENYVVMHHVFEELAGSDEKSPWHVNLNSFNAFCLDCKMIDNSSGYTRQADIDTLFIVANLEGGKNEKVIKLNPERQLSMYNFMDILIRLAIAKFTKEDSSTPPPVALQRLIDEHIHPMMMRTKMGLEPDIYRRQRFYTQEVEEMFKPHLPMLKAMYNYYKGLVRSKRLPCLQFVQIFEQCKLVGDNMTVSTREVVLSFVKARMLTIDPFEGKDKNEALGFIDFLEALCRVADCLSLCTEDELAELQDKPRDEDGESDREEESEQKTWFHLYKASLAGGTPLPRRKSTGFFAENTRPVEGKVEAMIDIMKGMLAEYFNLESGERLRRFFTQETRFDSGNVK